MHIESLRLMNLRVSEITADRNSEVKFRSIRCYGS